MRKTELTETVRKNIRAFRERAGLTQLELAKKLDVTQGLITHIECGKSLPTLTMIEDLAEIFETKPHLFLESGIFSEAVA